MYLSNRACSLTLTSYWTKENNKKRKKLPEVEPKAMKNLDSVTDQILQCVLQSSLPKGRVLCGCPDPVPLSYIECREEGKITCHFSSQVSGP